jgi:hypothetical protein
MTLLLMRFRAFLYGFIHPFMTDEERQNYAEREARKYMIRRGK